MRPAVTDPQRRGAHPAGATRRAHLLLNRVEPASVLRMALVAAVGFVVVALVLVATLYTLLDRLGVFDTLGRFSRDVGASSTGTVMDLGQVLTWTALVSTSLAIVGVAAATALAFLYNLVNHLVGGPEVTLTERR